MRSKLNVLMSSRDEPDQVKTSPDAERRARQFAMKQICELRPQTLAAVVGELDLKDLLNKVQAAIPHRQ